MHELVPKFGRFSVAPATFLDWRQQNTVFSQIGAMNSTGATLVSSTGAERIAGGLVSWDTFDLLQVSPALGRSFRAEEDAPGKDDVIILSHGMWQRRFGGDPAILGKSVTLSGTPVTVIGVMPAGFAFMADAEFWRPLALPANPSRGGHYLGVIARLKPGVTAEQAGAEIKTISERLAVQYPDTSANESAEVLGLQDSIVEGIRPALLTLLAAVGVVILIACANVANLLLVRASVRGKEIAIRTALGAGRGRLVLQMLSESLVLALAGGAVGLLLAYLAIDPIQKLSAGSIPRVAEIRIDGSVLLFALLVSLATGILFGLAPAWQASRSTIGSVLKEGGRSSTSSSGRWMRNALLVAEVAMSIVLLVGAALLLRSFARLTSVDPGFKPEHVLAFRVALPTAAYTDDQQRAAFFTQAARGARRAPRGHLGGSDADAADARRLRPVLHHSGAARAKAERRPVSQLPRRQPELLPDARHPAVAGTHLHRSRPGQVTDGGDRRSEVRRSSFSRPRSDRPGHRHRQRQRRLLRDRRRGWQHPPGQPGNESRADDVRAVQPGSVQRRLGRRADRRRSDGALRGCPPDRPSASIRRCRRLP